MDTLATTIQALHQNARQQTTVTFDTRLTEPERASALRRLRKAAAVLSKQRDALREVERESQS